MISAKELRIGNLVKDRAGNIWRVGCVTGMRNESKSLILEREVDDGIMKWYSGDDGYYLGLRDLEDDLSDPIHIKNLHHLQNLSMDLYGHDIDKDL